MLLEYGNALCNYNWMVEEKTPPGYSRIYYVYKGVVKYKDEQNNMRLKHGYLYIFPSSIPYLMNQNPYDVIYCTFLHIDFFPLVVNKLVEIQIDNIPALKYIMLSLKECINDNDINLINMLADVFISYCREHGYIESTDNRISKILLYIAEHISDKISIEKLSSLAGYNEQYFIRLFKKSTGITPYQYIVNYRLKEAKKLLNTDITISHIAILTGYSDVKTFSRAFKNKFGVAPSIYRDEHVNQP